MTKPSATLCIFAKPPRAGAVKTRLAATVGAEAAAALAGAFLDDTLALGRSLTEARVVLALAGDPGASAAAAHDAEVWPQGEGDLGARMERVLARALGEAPKALAIGTDSPGLALELLERALRALDDHDAVLGPADDGGFYLIGLRRCPEGLLAELPWSCATTLSETAARLRAHGLSVAMLPPWFDVDVVADLDRLRGLLDRGEVVAPATAQAIARLPARQCA
jgi:hypothetical protein